MILRSIDITNFKNIERASLEFSPKVNCLLGDNGMGKSNLLDALHLLSFTKSFTGAPDQMLIRSGEDFAIVRGDYERAGADEEIIAGLQRGRRKSFKRAGKEYKRISSHIGLLPLVMVSPADMDLINGAGEERRRFMDMVISQTDARYLDALVRYTRLLDPRNRLTLCSPLRSCRACSRATTAPSPALPRPPAWPLRPMWAPAPRHWPNSCASASAATRCCATPRPARTATTWS